ncbi:MAG: polyisoprenoid-binding protein [Alphaproteobacteria bacterium]|nr:polyisoprenoid-binding protein [Alphaproteobacteria bacterium]
MRHAGFAAVFATMIASGPLLPAPALAQQAAPAGDYVMDPTHASLNWQVLHQGMSWYTARFTGFAIDLHFDPSDVAKSKVSASIDPKSVETDYEKTRPAGNTTDFNAEIATNPRFLNAGKFPKITFVSTGVKKTGDKTGVMSGNLTFLGVTRPVTLDIAYVGDRNDPRIQKHKVGFQATGLFKRSDFGMEAGPVGDEVKVEINAEFVQK